MTTYLGVDIGKTKLAAGIVLDNGAVDFHLEEPTDTSGGGKKIIPQTLSIIRQVVNKGYSLSGIGVGSTGMIDHKRGYIIGSGSLPNFNNIPIKNILEEEFGVPVYVENDVHAAAIGEYVFGAGRHMSSMVLFAIGTGVGLGVIIEGKLLRGAHELAGQIAHIPLLGQNDITVNEIISGSGIAKRGTAILGREVSTVDVFKLAADGHQGASDFINEAIIYIGAIVAWTHNILDPEIIVLGGGVIMAEIGLVDQIRERATYFLKAYSDRLPSGLTIATSALRGQVGIIGAASLCLLG